MPRTEAKVYSNMDRNTINTLIKAEVSGWVVDTRKKYDSEFLLHVLKCLPYDNLYGVTVAAIVADLKANWRVDFKSPIGKKWDCWEEGTAVARAISANKNVKKKLGSGAFGSAFLMNDERVLKINTGKDSYDSWFSWALKCRDNHGANPLMPRVYEVTHFGTTYAAFMEKLLPWKREKMALSAFCDMEGYFMENPKFVYDRLVKEKVLGPDCNFDHVNEISLILTGIVQSVFKSRMDLHNDNAMFRENQLVITDPLAYGTVPEWLEPFEEVKKPEKAISTADVMWQDLAKPPKKHFDKGELFFNPFGAGFGGRHIKLLTHENWGWPIQKIKIDRRDVERELPEIKIKDNGKRFGLSVNKIERAKNFRLTLPDPWFRQQEKAHNMAYDALIKEMFAVGEPQSRHQMKILKGRKDVDAEGAQAP